ncbi:alpha/beta fold hydrolase [candidate division WOR-3 bacterium]|nr:alpha/beta fold hydrolase [candidate division WOR-3 bacterium]
MTNQGPSFSGELCRILTDDGLELSGLYAESRQKEKVKGQESKVCLVHVHGWDGNFYENRFIDHAAEACRHVGVAFAAFNNRGHDYVADLLRPAKRDYLQVGGMFERFREGMLDVKAAVDFASSRGCPEVILQGHSLGAMKVTYYLAKTHDPRVVGLVLLSPADTLGWIRQKLGRAFPAALAYAQRLVRQRRGRELMPSRFYDSPVSARTFVEAYGPKSLTGIFNISRTDRRRFPELATVSVPVLLAVGTVEEYFVGTAQEFVDELGLNLENCRCFTGVVIEGAPHNYLGHEQTLATELEDWLRDRIG